MSLELLKKKDQACYLQHLSIFAEEIAPRFLRAPCKLVVHLDPQHKLDILTLHPELRVLRNLGACPLNRK